MTPTTTTLNKLLEEEDLTFKERALHHKICKELNEILANKAIEDTIVQFPLIGTLQLIRRTRKVVNLNGYLTLGVNWGQTKKARKEGILQPGKVIYSKNSYRILPKWTRNKRVAGIKCYSFRFSRTGPTSHTIGFLNKILNFLNECDTNYLRFPLKK